MAIKLSLVGDVTVPEREITLTQAGKIIAFIGSETEVSDLPGESERSRVLALDLPTQQATKTKKSRSKKSSSAPAQLKVREEVSAIKLITPDLDGYPNYHKLPTKGAKVMWILAFAAANELETLRPNEIGYIAGKLRDRIDPRDVNGLTITAAKNGMIAKVNGSSYTLLHKGDEYLRELVNENQDK